MREQLKEVPPMDDLLKGDDLLSQIQSIFRDILDQPDLVLTRDSSAYTVEDWDSLAHVNLVTAIERKFKIKFALSELQTMRNVGDMLDLMRSKPGSSTAV